MKSSNKVITFLRRNAVYIILAFCILAIGLSTTLLILDDSKNTIPGEPTIENEQPSTPEDDSGIVDNPGETPDVPVIKVIEFIMPVDTTTYVEFSSTMVFNSTLNRFSAHKAMDFFAQEGTLVYAVYEGIVESVENDFLKGYTITINHGDGLKTVYNSLGEDNLVQAGQVVAKGDVIGEVSCTNRQEYKDGAHLHFEVIENDQLIDPSKYLSLSEK